MMKKFSMFVALCLAAAGIYAQNLDDVNKLLGKQQYADAKAAIDKLMADPKNATKSDVWYFKGRTYNAYSYDKQLSLPEKAALKQAAFEAFKKVQELDTKDMRLKLENYVSYIDLYGGFYDIGANAFNEKNFDASFDAFKMALQVEKYILDKGYTYPEVKLHALDTGLVLNTAIAAMQANKKEDAVSYYRMLTDANVSDKQYQEVYEYLVDYYSKKDDQTNLQQMLQKGKSLYPNSEFWTDVEVENVKKKGDKTALFAKYDELIAQNPNNFLLPYNYAIEMYNWIYVSDEKPANTDEVKQKLTEVLKKAIANDKGIDATILMTKHLYNVSSDLSVEVTKIKGTKPEDVKKKANLIADTKRMMEEFLMYGNSVLQYFEGQDEVSAIDKAKYKELITNMIEVRNYRKESVQAAELEVKGEIFAKKSVIKNSEKKASSVKSNESGNSSVGTVLAVKDGEVYKIPAKLNGLPLSFIFDSGASDVSISLVEATFMLKNGHLKNTDIIGDSKFQDATGKITVGTVINIRELEIAGISLKNVRASVVNNLKAPLLLGQSALSKFGKISFDYNTNTLRLEK